MTYELIITEKPKAAENIAKALADGKPIKETNQGVAYYKITRGKKDLVVACAVGHLYTLAEKAKKKFQYPVFDIEWKLTSEVNKSSKFSKKYVSTLKKLSKDADSFTVATDYDIEGEVIGYNVIRFICKQKDASRMKFSTLTKGDLQKAYDEKSKTLNWGQVNAGVARHFLDWYYGINLSRALTASLKKAGLFKIMSSGRVQGPTLKIIVEKEKEIQAFKPEPYWQIQLLGTVEKGPVEAWHEKDKFFKENNAKKVMEKTKDQKATVKSVNKKQFKQAPPTPFDLTTLQTEGYRVFKISPKDMLRNAQTLYVAGLISYPRTSSQQLPAVIGYKKILKALAVKEDYKKLVEELLKTKLKPNQGKKTDPAHPAIYPTGIKATGLNPYENKVYDIIVKRFMAVFAEEATRESNTIEIDVNKEIFLAKGTRTIDKGWHKFYEPYVRLKEEELPEVNKGDEVIVREIKLHAKETQPPKRYTQASIIKELSKRELGTKSTRAQIVDTLYNRGYVSGDPIEATNLGISTINTLEKYSPAIIDEKLTRKFELEMQDIREGKKDKEAVFDEAKQFLKITLEDMKEKEELIGKGLAFAKIESDEKERTLGKCPKCGSKLMLRKGKFGQFVACNSYPECKTTFNVPNNVLVKSLDKECKECGHPRIKIIRKGKRPQEVCLNTDCPSKKIEGEDEEIDKKCPKCDGDLVLRKSVYGRFYGCSKYPKCRYTEKING